MTHGDRSWTSGAVTYAHYKALVDDEHMPFIRASLSERVVETGLNWSAGQLTLLPCDHAIDWK